MFGESKLEDIWEDSKLSLENKKNSKKRTLDLLYEKVAKIKSSKKSYSRFRQIAKQNQKYKIDVVDKEVVLDICPVASDKTSCCNMHTLDIVSNCLFDCSYCSIKHFYKDNQIIFNKNIKNKLDTLKLSKSKSYHICTGELSDSLAWGNRFGILDSLNQFAINNCNVALELKTKSKNIEYLLDKKISKNIICSWSLNPQTIINHEEHLTASLEERLLASKELAKANILIGFHFHPIIYYKEWQEEYRNICKYILSNFKPHQVAFISFGTLTFTKSAIKNIRAKPIKSKILQMELKETNKKLSYPRYIKIEMFSLLYESFKVWRDRVFFYICMEKQDIWNEVFGYSYSTNEKFDEAKKRNIFKKIQNKKKTTTISC